MIYITSDTHLGHTNIIKYDKRPFASTEEHDAAIIKNWNERVRDNDTVYHLGDVMLADKERAKELFGSLNGKIILIRGNHDRTAIWLQKKYECFKEVHNYVELKDHGDFFCLFHYPIHEWNKCHHGAYMLHGHTHGNDNYDDSFRILNVSTNLHNYYPLTLDEIRKLLKDRVIRTHH